MVKGRRADGDQSLTRLGMLVSHLWLTWPIFGFIALAESQWGYVVRFLAAHEDGFWCGNALSDPFLLLVNVGGPYIAAYSALLAWGCFRHRRWPILVVVAFLLFLATTAGLAWEGLLLQRDYGIIILDRVWWLS